MCCQLRSSNKLYNVLFICCFMKIDSGIWKISSLGAVVASLCCLSPLILVMLGLSSVSFAASLSDTFYGSYKWYFRLAGLIFLGFFLFFYFRKKGICTIDQYMVKRNKVVNTILLTLVIATVIYIFWLYVVVEFVGKFYGIW